MLIDELRDQPIFLCGHPKSGTSLLRSLLDAHPQLLVYPEETVFFRRYLPLAKDQTLDQQLALAERYLIHIFTWNQTNPPSSQAGFPDRDYSAISFDDIRRRMAGLINEWGCRHAGDLLSAAILAYGQVTGQVSDQTLGLVEKTPYNERYVGVMNAWWPKAKYIHIVRDPRDNYLTYRRKHPDWTPEIFTTSWNHSTRLGFENQQLLGADRYWILRYEDLVLQPVETISKLIAFLCIQDHPTLRIPTRNGVAWQGNSMFTERFEGISGSAVERWRRSLSNEDSGVIQLVSGKYILG